LRGKEGRSLKFGRGERCIRFQDKRGRERRGVGEGEGGGEEFKMAGLSNFINKTVPNMSGFVSTVATK
jgi:hypothetical protein